MVMTKRVTNVVLVTLIMMTKNKGRCSCHFDKHLVDDAAKKSNERCCFHLISPQRCVEINDASHCHLTGQLFKRWMVLNG